MEAFSSGRARANSVGRSVYGGFGTQHEGLRTSWLERALCALLSSGRLTSASSRVLQQLLGPEKRPPARSMESEWATVVLCCASLCWVVHCWLVLCISGHGHSRFTQGPLAYLCLAQFICLRIVSLCLHPARAARVSRWRSRSSARTSTAASSPICETCSSRASPCTSAAPAKSCGR